MDGKEIQKIKLRFGIIGNSDELNRAIDIAMQVAHTDVSVLVTGESGVGKEHFPQIIHQNSARKHNKYIAVNCGAIPEGTIDSELFGHVKGAFTGAIDERNGYFAEANNGTIFLDEIGELPLSTQARLLRVLESGEYIKVGSSRVEKTNVRIVAATNVNLVDAIAKGDFREDLYYRLNTVPISVPPLRERVEDIPLLFRKFAADVAVQYKMPAIQLDEGAKALLQSHYWRGNVRQLKNVAEQISALEKNRVVTADVLATYLSPVHTTTSAMSIGKSSSDEFSTERELLYKILFDMRSDINDLKRMLSELMHGSHPMPQQQKSEVIGLLPSPIVSHHQTGVVSHPASVVPSVDSAADYAESEVVVDEVPAKGQTKADMQREQILRALKNNNGRRRDAARELFLSERTLYRRIKELGISDDDI